MSRRVPTPYAQDLHHLVIELKRPKKPLSAEDTQQIRAYAYAIEDDERFKGVNTKWHFWLVGNSMHKYVEHELDNDEPAGVLQRNKKGNLVISVRCWAQIINEARARMRFFQDELNYEVNRDDALERLRATYAHILGGPSNIEAGDEGTELEAGDQEFDVDEEAV